jgi:hypothetical protein
MRSSFTTGICTNFAFLTGHIAPEKEETSICYVARQSDLISQVKHIGKFDPQATDAAMKDVLRLRPYWGGDFTALTPPSDSREAIVAFTLRLPAADRGAVLVFRREEAPDTYVIRLPELHPKQQYLLTVSREDLTESQVTVTGKTLQEGFSVQIPETPGSLLIFYKPQ